MMKSVSSMRSLSWSSEFLFLSINCQPSQTQQ
jgi:hypothetical protein